MLKPDCNPKVIDLQEEYEDDLLEDVATIPLIEYVELIRSEALLDILRRIFKPGTYRFESEAVQAAKVVLGTSIPENE